MTFPLMPISGGPTFVKGALTQQYSSALTSPFSKTINIGQPSENRWVVLMAGGSAGGSIGTWSSPTCNGSAMTQIAQDGATLGNDGQRGAIWVAKVTQGTSVTLSGTLNALDAIQVYTMTGVRDAVASAVSGQIAPDSRTQNVSMPACTLYYGVDNFGSVTSISNMDSLVNLGGNAWFAVDYVTSSNPITYTVVKTSVALNRFVSWPFSY